MATTSDPDTDTTVKDPQSKEKRTVRLTDKALEIFEQRVVTFKNRLEEKWDSLQYALQKQIDTNNKQDLKQKHQQVSLNYGEFRAVIQEYSTYLTVTRSEECKELLEELNHRDQRCEREVCEALQYLADKQIEVEIRSRARSHRSNTSKSRSEKAKIKLEYAQREYELKKKQLALQEREAIIAAQIAREKNEVKVAMEMLNEEKNCAESEDDVNSIQSDNQNLPNEIELPNDKMRRFFESSTEPEANVGVQMSRLLLQKDLSLNTLTNFNDTVEHYTVWKVGFKTATKELGITSDQEVELLIRWLGPQSKAYAQRIRAANISDSRQALRNIWSRLDERYAAPELVEASLKGRLAAFPKITMDYKRLYELSDLLAEIEATKQNEKYKTVLAQYDSSTGINPIIQKLPNHLQHKWTDRASKFMSKHNVLFPPFSELCNFVAEMSKRMNNPSFVYDDNKDTRRVNHKTEHKNEARKIYAYKTGIQENKASISVTKMCMFHSKEGHTLDDCKTFASKPLNVRKKFFRDKNLCFKCGRSSEHVARACTETIKCKVCDRSNHPTALHWYGGEQESNSEIKSFCTNVCGSELSPGKSCAKVVLVTVHSNRDPNQKKTLYALIDEQSNKSLAKAEFFDMFDEKYSVTPYTLSSCAGVTNMSGRKSTSEMFTAKSINGQCSIALPPLTECDHIPDNKSEIPTEACALNHPHLQEIAPFIKEDKTAKILLLLGRDIPEAHHILDQRISSIPGSPYAQKLRLGWVVVGETCLGKVHQPNVNIQVMKTVVNREGNESIFPQCDNYIKIKDDTSGIFETTRNDDKIGKSVEDKEFLKVMDKEFSRNPEGHWEAPLPFQTARPRLPNNRNMVLHRTKTLIANLSKNPTRQEHFMEFMQKVLDNKHAEEAAPLSTEVESWYLPIFGVYHPKKKQIRVVFDSSAKCMGLSLNKVLMSGPDLNNSLLGILMRFRREPIAVSSDIQQMFYQFYVNPDDRDFLRFFWFKDNNPSLPLVEYRMCVHVFGNSPSPSIAKYGLHRSVKEVEHVYGQDVVEFVTNDFYVDDGLTSLPSPEQAIDLLKRSQQALEEGGKLKLHKILSNSRDVMQAFPREELANDIKDLDLGQAVLPTQRSLGLGWNLNNDSFTFQICDAEKPYTRRGVLSTLNSLFDPLGFIAPVVVQGRVTMRDLVQDNTDWDKPLPSSVKDKWYEFCKSLKTLEDLSVPRTYFDGSLSATTLQEVHVFADASESAIAAVAYLRVQDTDGDIHVGFIMGKSKVSPRSGHTIPRLELCAAVLAVELADTISEHLDIPVAKMKFYTDSRVVLGYIYNQTRRFYVYVENRVSRILRCTKSQQWSFVGTRDNPADIGTRPTPPESLQDSVWLKGPQFLYHDIEGERQDSKETYELQNPTLDTDIRPEISCMKSSIGFGKYLIVEGVERFSSWERFLKAVVTLKKCCRRRWLKLHGKEESQPTETVEMKVFAEKLIIMAVQHRFYADEIECLQRDSNISKSSHIISLDPYLDDDQILRVGGRLRHSKLPVKERSPILIPGKHHISRLLVRHYHDKAKHQGRQITEGAIREAGYWITGSKRLITSIVHLCVKCRRLRGKLEYQKMADLPEDRLTPGPPFSSVGLDCFGPWQVTTRRTRGGQASSKRWAVMFTCLTSRAVHIEVIEELTSSSFINALRRFTSIRGKVQLYRSDQGTNFIGALDDLGFNISHDMKCYLDHEGSVWILNPPHSSHRGGVWERMIGITRRILDSLLLDLPGGGLTHEVLVTFLAEATAIINSRPLVPLSSDVCNSSPLTPSVLLTQKGNSIGEVVVPTDIKNMYKAQWKRVQMLAEHFWKRWRLEFLNTLQTRRKWTSSRSNLQIGDVVMMKDATVRRLDWPMGIIERAEQDKDGKVRTVVVRTTGTSGNIVHYTRPVNEVVMLVSVEP